MDTEEKTQPLRPYLAIIWGSGPQSVGIRTTYYAVDLVDARKQLVAEYGKDCISTVWNEEDAAKPR